MKSYPRRLLVGKVLGRQRRSDDVKHTGQVDLKLGPHSHRKQAQGLERCSPLLLLLDTAQDVVHGILEVLGIWYREDRHGQGQSSCTALKFKLRQPSGKILRT